MKRLFLIFAVICGIAQVQAQMVVTAPSLEVQEAMNHVEQMQQAVQTYQTMMGVKQGIDKTVDAVEKVNSKLATIREVQEIATRSAACVKRIRQVYDKISAMKVDRRYTTNLLSLCSQTTRECVNVTAYGAKIFTSNFLRLSDAERLNETRQVLDNIDKLLARVNYINLQADAVKFNNQLLNAYFK